jgi:hypothetical protein
MSASRGAYGLNLPRVPGQQWLNEVPDEWPTWDIEYSGAAVEQDQRISADQARLNIRPDGMVHIDRLSATSVVLVDSAPPEAAYVHPLLGTTAIMAAEWAGRISFHGGCVLDRAGRAWALIGDREAGKSTTLAWFHMHGRTVFADDVVITDGIQVVVGPRCIDLREASSRRFGLGQDIGVVGTRPRWRVDLPQTVSTAPLGGFVVLGWASESTIEPVPLADRARMLGNHRGLLVGQQHVMPWLEALAAPMWLLRRPQDWAALDAHMEKLVDTLDESPARGVLG